MAFEKKDKTEILPGYEEVTTKAANNSEMCTVLYGYGRVKPEHVSYIDSYKFIGGVGRNIPRSVAECWKKGVRSDGKPAVSRVFPQAILPANASDADFVAATGITLMPAAELAAMINATDARALTEALGLAKAAELVEKLRANLQTA